MGCQSIFFIYFFQDDITTTITTATFQSLKVYHQKAKLRNLHRVTVTCPSVYIKLPSSEFLTMHGLTASQLSELQCAVQALDNCLLRCVDELRSNRRWALERGDPD